MRPIKFRAWHVSEGKYQQGCCNVMLDLNGLPYWQFGLDAPNPRDRGNFVIEQFTGLHDAEGREIYEGDIVRYRLEGSSTKPEYRNPEYVVTYDAPTFDLQHCGGSKKDPGSHFFVLKHGGGNKSLTVIGNIHEHPHLLETSND